MKVARIKPRWLNMRDTARYLGMAYGTLTNQRWDGTFPLQARIRGGKPYYELEELDKLMDETPRENGV